MCNREGRAPRDDYAGDDMHDSARGGDDTLISGPGADHM